MTARPVMGGVEWLLLVALSLLWGGSFFFTEVTLAELPPFTVVLGRVGLAAGALLLLVALSGHRLPCAPEAWGTFLVMGVIYFRILARAGATNLLLVTSLIPVSALALGIGLLGEHLAPGHLGGMALIALGLAAIDDRPLRWLARRPRGVPQLRP